MSPGGVVQFHHLHLAYPYLPVAGLLSYELDEARTEERENGIRPAIPATVFSPSTDKDIDVQLVVDSGADVTILNAALAEELGIDVQDGRPGTTHGLVGSIPAHHFELCLGIGGIRFSAEVGFVEGLPVAGVLGRRDVFERFNIQFRERDHKVILCAEVSEEYSPQGEYSYCADQHTLHDEQQCLELCRECVSRAAMADETTEEGGEAADCWTSTS